jgi:hypothetical protein
MPMVAAVSVRSAAGPEGGLARRTEAGAISCEAGLRFPDVGYGVAAESERIMSAGLAGGLSRGRADRRGHRGAQQAERNDCREPHKISSNILHPYNPHVILTPLTAACRRAAGRARQAGSGYS